MKTLIIIIYLVIGVCTISNVSDYITSINERKKSETTLHLLEEIHANDLETISALKSIKSKIEKKTLTKQDSIDIKQYLGPVESNNKELQFDAIAKQIKIKVDSIIQKKYGRSVEEINQGGNLPLGIGLTFGFPDDFKNKDLVDYVVKHLPGGYIIYHPDYKVKNKPGLLYEVIENPTNAGILISFFNK